MRKDVQDYLMSDNERRRFIREQPYWYRYLSRNPGDLPSFQLAMMNYYEKTIPHRVNQFSSSLQMAQMMIQMFHAMRAQD